MCSVVTTARFQFAQKGNKWLPAGPPNIPNSCWTETTSTLLVFRKSGGAPIRHLDSAPQSRTVRLRDIDSTP